MRYYFPYSRPCRTGRPRLIAAKISAIAIFIGLSRENADVTTVFFDMYGTLCDTSSVTRTLREELGVADALVADVDVLWREKQLQYSYQRALMDDYRPFWEITAEALDYALALYDLDPDEATRERILDAYAHLTPYSGAIETLESLSGDDHTVAVLSNGNPEMLAALAENAELAPHLDAIVSADGVETFKPAPIVYEHAAAEFDRSIEDCWLVSSNAWDVAGAGSAGMNTAWVNRSLDPRERIGPESAVEASDLPGVGSKIP